MTTVHIKEDGRLEAEEKMIALNILLVIYLHDERYFEALRDTRELLGDAEMQEWREELGLKQNEIRQIWANSRNKRKPSFLQVAFNCFIRRLDEVFKVL